MHLFAIIPKLHALTLELTFCVRDLQPEVLKFLKRIVEAKPGAVNAKTARPVIDACAKACDDSTPDIREAAYGQYDAPTCP